jgi:hypothetical protein
MDLGQADRGQRAGMFFLDAAPDLETPVGSQPVRYIRTLSPGESVLTSAASQAPVPEAGQITTRCPVLKTGSYARQNLAPRNPEFRRALLAAAPPEAGRIQ